MSNFSTEKICFFGTIFIWTYVTGTVFRLKPPIAKRIPHNVYYGVNPVKKEEDRGDNPMNPPIFKTDYYYWLRDDARSNPEVLEYLNSENAYCKQEMKRLSSLQSDLYNEILSHLQETDSDVPYKEGDYLYYSRTQAGLPYKIHCRKSIFSEKEKIILDENEVAKGHKYSVVASVEPSPDHELLAFAVDHNGYETYNLKVKKIESEEFLPDETEAMSGTIVWGADNSAYFYLKMDDEHRPNEVWMHLLGTHSDNDILIHEETDAKFWMGIGKTASKRFLVITSSSKETDECHVIDLKGVVGAMAHDEAIGNKKCIRKRQFGVRYEVEHHGDKFYIVTNIDQSKNNKLVYVDADAVLKGKESSPWIDVKPYNKNIQIEEVLPFANHLAIFGREDGFEQIWIADTQYNIAFDISTASWKRCEWPEAVYSVWEMQNYEFNVSTIRLAYSSLVTPKQILELDMNTMKYKLLKNQSVPNYNKDNYKCCRIEALAEDSTTIPISMVYHKNIDPFSKVSPVLLYGYGSYGSCVDPIFDFKRISLLDRGVVFAIAHIRGGGEMGRNWYEDEGKYLKKKNTFTDFASCAKHLINNGVTVPGKLAILGRSAGGLLMGAMANMYPELFKAIIADVPFVDVMNSMCDPTIPLTITEWEEWGNPNEEKYHSYMDSYSPYDNVAAKVYPSMLVTAGLNDPRVAYWEPAKWVSKLRYYSENTNKDFVLLKTDMSAGHFSASDRYKYIEETAFEYSFILDKITDFSKV